MALTADERRAHHREYMRDWNRKRRATDSEWAEAHRKRCREYQYRKGGRTRTQQNAATLRRKQEREAIRAERQRLKRIESRRRQRERDRVWREANRERWRILQKHASHRRRARKLGNLTSRELGAMYSARTMCPLCGRKMRTDVPNAHPRQKTIDHIVPLNAGGTHLIGNVRIVCRQCNIRRPHDGSDYEGQLALAV